MAASHSHLQHRQCTILAESWCGDKFQVGVQHVTELLREEGWLPHHHDATGTNVQDAVTHLGAIFKLILKSLIFELIWISNLCSNLVTAVFYAKSYYISLHYIGCIYSSVQNIGDTTVTVLHKGNNTVFFSP